MNRDDLPHTGPQDAPISDDQSDLPDVSQLGALEAMALPRPKPLREWDNDNVSLNPSQITELRLLIARRDRAQNDINAFVNQFITKRQPKSGGVGR